jgi:hypothetical protein
MTTRRQAAYSKGGFVLEPLVSQEQASEMLGWPIPDDAWHKIALAFARFGDGMDDLATSRPNNAKGDPQSWHRQHRASVADLNCAFKCIDRVTRDRHAFLMDALDNYSLQQHGHSGSLEVIRALNDAKQTLIRAMTMIERAEPHEIEVPTEATLKADLIRSIYDAVTKAGLAATLSSNGAASGLTRFESFLLSLGIKRGNSDRAFAKAVRRAVPKLG